MKKLRITNEGACWYQMTTAPRASLPAGISNTKIYCVDYRISVKDKSLSTKNLLRSVGFTSKSPSLLSEPA